MLVVVWRVTSWVAREERADCVVLRSCRRRVISSLFGELPEVDVGFEEVEVVFLRSARRVSGRLLVGTFRGKEERGYTQASMYDLCVDSRLARASRAAR